MDDIALITLSFDKFIECENSWKLKPLYMETSESFRLFMLMEAQVFSTEITFEEIRTRFGNSPMVIELFRSTYIRDAIKINSIDTESSAISKDIKVDASELKTVLDGFLDNLKKFTLTSTGGQGTAGYAMIPVRLGSGKIRRCESCGNILLSGETSCPACGSERITDKDAEMEISKWIGWDFVGDIKWILLFLEKYTMSQITDVNSEQKISIKDALIHSITEGWTLNKLENTIDVIVEDEEKARLIARTEVIRCANEGALLHYEDSGIEKVRWIAVPSAPGGRTCDRCLALNGKEFLLKDVKGKIPLHPFCRCCYSPIVEK